MTEEESPPIDDTIEKRRKQLFILHHLLSLCTVCLLFVIMLCLAMNCNVLSLCFAVIFIISLIIDGISLSLFFAVLALVLNIGYYLLFPVIISFFYSLEYL